MKLIWILSICLCLLLHRIESKQNLIRISVSVISFLFVLAVVNT
jgi:hypothetical protein